MEELEQGRILIVDDEDDLRTTLRDRLAARGYETTACGSGEEALEALKAEPFDLLLTDLMMPGMSGLELLRAGLELDPHLVGILMTGQATVSTAVEALKAGAFDYITKPFKLAGLRPVLSRAMELRRLRTQNVQLRETVSIYELSQAVAATLDASVILQQIAEAAVQQCDASEACVLRLTESGEELAVAAVHGSRQGSRPGDRVRLGEGVAGWVAEHREPVAFPAETAEPRTFAAAREHGGTFAAVPMLAGGKLVGVLTVQATARVRPFTGGQVKALAILAGTGAAALENALLYEQAQREIEERRAVEEALRATNERMEQALSDLARAQAHIIEQERLRALGQMASGIAHDFNNALMPVLGFTELLLNSPDSLQDAGKVRVYLELMNTAARDAASVVTRLREFYRSREEGEIFAPTRLGRLVEQVVELTRPKWKDQALALGKTVSIEQDLQPVPQIPGDAAQLREVLTNLIFNAVDAMPEGGTITVRTRRGEAHVLLEVTDTGTGMSDAVRKRCLEPFFTTKREQGTGLGLSMVHGIIRRHSGKLDIESAPGRGTTFRISLPINGSAANSAILPPGPPEPGGQGGPSRHLRVLVVDDDDAVRGITVAYLETDGHELETAGSGGDALLKFRQGKFDLVITDRAMPGMNGDALARAIKKEAPQQPVILLTGFGDLMSAQREHPEGVDVVLGKPAPLAVLRDAIRGITRSS